MRAHYHNGYAMQYRFDHFTGTVTRGSIRTMEVSSIRARNITMLVERGGGPTAFGQMIDRDQAQVSQWTSETKPKPIGGRLARYIEEKLGHERGWLDHPQWDGDEVAPHSRSHALRLDPEIVSSAHKALRDMYALKKRVYHEDDVARFLLLYEKYAMRKAGVSEAELLGAGLDDTEMPQGAASGRRDDGVPDAGADKRVVARRVRR